MIDVLDLVGASGAAYRFRLVDSPTRLPARAGNFALVRREASTAEVVCLGSANNLTLAGGAQAEVTRSNGPVVLYARLNVGRGARLSEHEDLMGVYRPPLESVLEDDLASRTTQ